MKKTFLTFFALTLIVSKGLAAEGDIRQIPSASPTTRDNIQFNITLGLHQREADNKGTDVTNIYAITVALESPTAYTKSYTNKYTIVYYVDGRMTEAMAGSLPFSFERNYKGLLPGSHEIKVEVEDGADHVLARKNIQIDVR